MVEPNAKIHIIKERRYTFHGVFDLEKTYNYTKDFLELARRYALEIPDFLKTESPTESEIEVKIKAKQDFSEYYRNHIELIMTLKGKKVEVEIGAEKQNLVRGSARVVLRGSVEKNYKKEEPSNKISKFVGLLYRKYVAKDEMGKAVGSVVDDVNSLFEIFKENSYPEI
ncbi:MAG: hypothetical protein ACOCXG_05385 [Nanoarchaeota archaeon]